MRFARFGRKDEEGERNVLNTGKYAPVTAAYSRMAANQKVDVPQNVPQRMAHQAEKALRDKLYEEFGRGGVNISLKEARVAEKSDKVDKEIHKAQFGFEIEIVSTTGQDKKLAAVVQYDNAQPQSKQYSVVGSLLLPGDEKVGFTREAISEYMQRKAKKVKLAVFFDSNIKRYRVLGEGSEQLVTQLRSAGHYVRDKHIDGTIVPDVESMGYEVIATEDELADQLRALAQKWEERSFETKKNVSQSELLPSLPDGKADPSIKQPTDNVPTKDEPGTWQDRALDSGTKIPDAQMLKMEQKKKAQEYDDKDNENEDEEEPEKDEEKVEEDEEKGEEVEEEAEEVTEEPEEVEEMPEGGLAEEVIEEAPAVAPAQEIIDQAAEQVKEVLEDATVEIKEEAAEEIREEVTEQVQQEVKDEVKQEVMDAIEQAVSSDAFKVTEEIITEEPVMEESIEEPIVSEIPEEIMAEKKRGQIAPVVPAPPATDLPGVPDIAAPQVENPVASASFRFTLADGKQVVVEYDPREGKLIARETPPTGVPKELPMTIIPQQAPVAAKKKKVDKTK